MLPVAWLWSHLWKTMGLPTSVWCCTDPCLSPEGSMSLCLRKVSFFPCSPYSMTCDWTLGILRSLGSLLGKERKLESSSTQTLESAVQVYILYLGQQPRNRGEVALSGLRTALESGLFPWQGVGSLPALWRLGPASSSGDNSLGTSPASTLSSQAIGFHQRLLDV